MKRFALLLISLALLISISSCSTKHSPPSSSSISSALSSPYDAEIRAEYKGMAFTAKIHKILPGYCDISFSSPKSLKDLSVSFKENCVDISYKGISVSLDPDEISGSAAAALVVSALDKITSPSGIDVALVDSALIVSGETNGDYFELRLDPKTYNILSLNSPSKDLKVEFVNFDFVRTE